MYPTEQLLELCLWPTKINIANRKLHAPYTGETENIYNLVGKVNGISLLGRAKNWWDNNINIIKQAYKVRNQSELVTVWIYWRLPVITEINIWSQFLFLE
jgi:hypothetical protein